MCVYTYILLIEYMHIMYNVFQNRCLIRNLQPTLIICILHRLSIKQSFNIWIKGPRQKFCHFGWNVSSAFIVVLYSFWLAFCFPLKRINNWSHSKLKLVCCVLCEIDRIEATIFFFFEFCSFDEEAEYVHTCKKKGLKPLNNPHIKSNFSLDTGTQILG